MYEIICNGQSKSLSDCVRIEIEMNEQIYFNT